MKRGVLCRLAALFPGERSLRPLDEHRRSCLQCQAETTRQRAWAREMTVLRGELVPAPDGLQARVLAGLGAQDAANPRRALVARAAARYAALAGLASASLVALAAGLARRHSRALG